MSRVKDNVVTRGLSGKLGKQVVFRQWSGDTFLCKAPVMNPGLLKSEMREKNRLRFKEAVKYAKKAMDDLELKQAYQSKCKKRQNAYSKAVQDFFNSPSIEEIDLSNYTGEVDSFIRVYATDDFRVKRVQINIENKQTQVVEAGLAEQESNTDWWKFIAKESNPSPEGGKVVVTAYDQPGNETTQEAYL